MNQIADNIDEIRKKIGLALENPTQSADIHLIAVTKTIDPPQIRQAIAHGIRDLGENKVQEIERKFDLIPEDVRWHLIGSLQTNKVKYIIDKVSLIHSLDRISLAQEIDKRARQKNLVMDCLVQVNISHEDSKHGVEESQTLTFVSEVASRYPNIRIKGLMGMAPLEAKPEDTRPYFKNLKQIFDAVSQAKILGVEMKHLSMGMSGDYPIALAEGATMVRIGTAIFGKRQSR